MSFTRDIEQYESTANSSERLSVVYLGGHARSGSTVFEMLLGEILEHSFCAGELTHLPLHITQAVPCSMGHSLDRCPIWGEVVSSFSREFWTELAQMRDKMENRIIARGASDLADKDYASRAVDVLLTIAATTGASVVIDSSKTQLRGRRRHELMMLDDRIQTTFVHLERPFTASVRSAYKSKGAPTGSDRAPLVRALLTPVTRELSQREAKRQVKLTGGSTIEFDRFRSGDAAQVRRVSRAVNVPEPQIVEAMSKAIEPRCSIGGNRLRQPGTKIRIQREAK